METCAEGREGLYLGTSQFLPNIYQRKQKAGKKTSCCTNSKFERLFRSSSKIHQEPLSSKVKVYLQRISSLRLKSHTRGLGHMPKAPKHSMMHAPPRYTTQKPTPHSSPTILTINLKKIHPSSPITYYPHSNDSWSSSKPPSPAAPQRQSSRRPTHVQPTRDSPSPPTATKRAQTRTAPHHH